MQDHGLGLLPLWVDTGCKLAWGLGSKTPPCISDRKSLLECSWIKQHQIWIEEAHLHKPTLLQADPIMNQTIPPKSMMIQINSINFKKTEFPTVTPAPPAGEANTFFLPFSQIEIKINRIVMFHNFYLIMFHCTSTDKLALTKPAALLPL